MCWPTVGSEEEAVSYERGAPEREAPPLYGAARLYAGRRLTLQGYLAHKKLCPPLGPTQGPRRRRSVGSYGGAVSYERGTPVRGAPPLYGAARLCAGFPLTLGRAMTLGGAWRFGGAFHVGGT